jgi:hypothetical protein
MATTRTGCGAGGGGQGGPQVGLAQPPEKTKHLKNDQRKNSKKKFVIEWKMFFLLLAALAAIANGLPQIIAQYNFEGDFRVKGKIGKKKKKAKRKTFQ